MTPESIFSFVDGFGANTREDYLLDDIDDLTMISLLDKVGHKSGIED